MKKTILALLLSTASASFAHTPAEASAKTPCGEHDCPCPEELKKAHEAEQIKKLGLDPKLIEALNYHNAKQKMETTEEKLSETKKRLVMDGLWLLASIATAATQRSMTRKKNGEHLINGLYIAGVANAIVASFFGARDAATYYHHQQILNKLNQTSV